MPTGVQRQPPVAAAAAGAGTGAAGQHIKPSHFWSSSFAPPSHYWDHSQSHSLLEIETLSVSDPRGAGYASLPSASLRPAHTLERASKSSSLKRLCGKGVTRMGSYLETLHRSARIADIPESAEEGGPEETAVVEASPVRASPPPRVPGRRQSRVALREAFGGAAEGPPAVRTGPQEHSSSDESSEDNSQGAGRSPVPSSHIYIDMPPRRRVTSVWNCASGSEPESDEWPSRRRQPAPAANLLAPCGCRARPCGAGGTGLDPWDHRAIEYVMVPKSQYLSLYRANRLLRDPCCCQGLGRASKLCDNCLRPTVILRSPSPASAAGGGLPGTSGTTGGTNGGTAGSTSSSGVSSMQTRRTAATSSPPERAQTLLPRLTKNKLSGKKSSRHTHFSSQELLLDYDSDQQIRKWEPPARGKMHSSKADIVLSGNCHVPMEGNSTTLRRGPMRLDYTDSWRSLSRNTSSPAGSSGGSR